MRKKVTQLTIAALGGTAVAALAVLLIDLVTGMNYDPFWPLIMLLVAVLVMGIHATGRNNNA